MKNLISLSSLKLAAMAGLLLLPVRTVLAQNGPPAGGFNPQAMREQQLQRLREQFEITDDTEWKVVAERVTKVMDARRAANTGGGPGGFAMLGGPGGPPPNRGGSGGPGGAGPSGNGGQNPPGGANFSGPPPGGNPGFRREPNPELEALQKAIDAKAPSAELKAKIGELKAARVKRQAELEKAREELRQVLSARQEAIAMTMGLL